MNTKINYLHVFRRRWGFIVVITLIVVLLSLIFTLFQPFEYSSKVKILVIQKSSVGLDAYSASKSAERIGRNLGQIIYSSSFFSKVLNSDFEIDKTYFSGDEEKKRKQWQKMINTEVPASTNILHIEVFHKDKEQAQIIASAVTDVLLKNAAEYIGLVDVELKVVDLPLTSNFPDRPNVLLNLTLGLFVGFFLALSILMVTFSESKEFAHLQVGLQTKKPQSKFSQIPRPTFHVDENLSGFAKSNQPQSSLDNNFGLSKFEKPMRETIDNDKPMREEKVNKTYSEFEDEDQIKTLNS